MMSLIETAAYMPHGYCLLWQPWLVMLHAGPDALIFLAYSAIPLALLRVLSLRPDLREYRSLIVLFAAFILLCGMTHLLSLITLWVPIYPLHGVFKLVTAIVSVATAAVLFQLVPHLAAIPSPGDMARANDRLRAEIAAHERTLAALQRAHEDLEAKVEERTEALSRSNARLEILTRETVHRSKNLLTVIMSILRQTARTADSLDGFLERFTGRIEAMSRAVDATIRQRMAGGTATLGGIVEDQLASYRDGYGERVQISGPRVEISGEAGQQVALAIHELATNAVKYGALSSDDGEVGLSWEIGNDGLTLVWSESVGTAPAALPQRGGFGWRLLTQLVPMQLEGTAGYCVDDGRMTYRLSAPLASILQNDAAHDIDGTVHVFSDDGAVAV